MQRVQVGDLSRPEGLQVTVSPNIQATQAGPAPRIQDNSAARLGQSLGVLTDKVGSALEDQERKEAEAFFNSKTIGDIGKAMKDGALLPQKNPVFVATVQNLYGQNVMQQHMRNTESQVTSGELSFPTAQHLEGYLVKQRNELLNQFPGNKFIQSGYDQSFNQYKKQILNSYSGRAAKALIENGEAQVTDALQTTAASILNPENKLSPKESITKWMAKYDVMKSTVLFDPKARKDALYDNASSFAAAGRPDLVKELLDYKTDNGLTVRAILGNRPAEALFVTARNRWEQQLKNAQKIQIEAIQNQQADAVNQEVRTKLSAGQGGFIPSTYETIDSSGNPKTVKTDNVVKRVLAEQTQGLELPQQIDRYARNGIVNDSWSSIINSGVTNLYTVGTSFGDKQMGELSPAGQEAFNLFRQLHTISPEYSRKVVKGDRDFQILQTMDDMINLGWAADANEAATLMNDQGRLGIAAADFAAMRQKVAVAVESYTIGWFVDEDKNTTALNSRVRKIAEIALKSGRSPNAEHAVEAAVAHVEATSIRFNGAIYSRDQLPLFPQGDPADFWMDEFAENKIDPMLKEQLGNRYDHSDFFLKPNPDGQGFTLTLPESAAPLLGKDGMPITFSKDDMVNYAKEQYSGAQGEAALKQSYRFFSQRMNAQYRREFPSAQLRGNLVKSPIPSFEEYKEIRDKTVEGPGGKQVPVQTLPLKEFMEWMKEHNGQ